jgi:hypothetical protein
MLDVGLRLLNINPILFGRSRMKPVCIGSGGKNLVLAEDSHYGSLQMKMNTRWHRIKFQ